MCECDRGRGVPAAKGVGFVITKGCVASTGKPDTTAIFLPYVLQSRLVLCLRHVMRPVWRSHCSPLPLTVLILSYFCNTPQVMKKKPKKGGKPDAKPQTKIEPVESFFNFFSPPNVRGQGQQ